MDNGQIGIRKALLHQHTFFVAFFYILKVNLGNTSLQYQLIRKIITWKTALYPFNTPCAMCMKIYKDHYKMNSFNLFDKHEILKLHRFNVQHFA